MIKRIFFSVLVIFSIFVFSTPNTVHASWIKAYGIPGAIGNVIGPTTDCNYLLWLTSGSGITKTVQVSELDSAGTPQWTKKIYGSGEYDLMMMQLADGGYFVYGNKTSTSTGDDIVWEKFNSSWVKQYGNTFGGAKDESGGFNMTDDGGFLITGTTKSYLPDGSDQDMLFIKLSSAGAIEWNKAIHHGLKDGSPGIAEVSDGYLYTAAVQGDASEPTNIQQNILVGKINKAGTRQWQKLFSGTAESGTWVISLAAPHEVTGGYLLWGTTKAHSYDNYGDILIVKIDASGTILWKKKFTTGSDDLKAYLYDVKENADGTLLVSGIIGNATDYLATADAFLLKLSSDGSTISWQKKMGGPGYDILSLIEASDGDYLLTGTSTSFGSSTYDYDIFYSKLGIDLSTGALTFRFQKNFGSSEGMESGILFDYLGQLMLFGMTTSWGPGAMNVLGGFYLDENGGMGDCEFIKDVTLTVATPTMAVSDATLTSTPATLTDRSVGTASDLSLTVATGTTPTKVDICEAGTTGCSYTIAGTITSNGSTLSGVTVTLSGSGSDTKTTDSSGDYTFSGLSNGTYTITPSKSGYTFTPVSKSVTISGSNKTGQNFTATQSTSGCSQWSDVIEKYNQYVGGQAGWADVISCYNDYVTP